MFRSRLITAYDFETRWWAYIVVLVLTCSVAYRQFNQPWLSTGAVGPSEQSERHPLEQGPEPPLTWPLDEGRVHGIESSLPNGEYVTNPVTGAKFIGIDTTTLATRGQQTLQVSPGNQADVLTIYDPRYIINQGEILNGGLGFSNSDLVVFSSAPAPLEPDQLQEEALLENGTRSITSEHSEWNDIKQNLSYLAYYAYSEVPPETKPAHIVLSSLKTIPRGTPVDEIKRVSDVLGLDFTFMKTVAKIESGFDPKQRTGSYIGLFQLSKSEFKKYGEGDILDPRDNAVAAALKLMTENAMFEMFTNRKPTLSDDYLIHQQGVAGAAEHVSHPHRLAWRSMCATDEGKEKGEKWCRRAIWGNTLPALKRIWKNVNNITSGAFVAMWQQRVSGFYARYSEAATN
jgi:Transglycosylase SLT domain